ncbi:MAG: hypothetical protein R2702_06675 [Acidimicrobiales bacterium]
MDAAKGGVVMTPWAPGQWGARFSKVSTANSASAAGLGDPFDVEDDAAVDVFAAAGGDPLGSPGGLAGAFEVQPCAGLGKQRSVPCRSLSSLLSPGCALKSGVTTLLSAWISRVRSGLVHDPDPRVEQPDGLGL